MARLLPADFELREIDDPAERSVVRSLVEALDDQWIVVPNVRVKTPKHDIEIDVVVAHPGRGVVLVEVKGGPVAVTDGVWTSYGNRLRPPPDEQIIRAKHGLVRRLRTMGIDLTDLFIVDTVGLPHVRNVPPEGLGTALPRERILDGTVLDDPGPAFEAILREHDPVPVERFERFLTALKPTVVLDGGTGRASPAALRLLDEATTERLDALRALGDHDRVVVTGGPGTGKTWLVLDWARRAARRGDRTAVICFNRPIANQLAAALDGHDLIVATYHSLLMDHLLPGHDFAVPPGAGQEYWDHVPTAILAEHLDAVEQRFDTFIVDEAQDLRPQWFDSLETLLDPAGPRRILMTVDEAQMIYVSPDRWRRPDGVVTLPLETNLRSCRHVAAVIEHLGGPSPLPSAPAGLETVLLPSGPRETVKSVRRRVRELVTDHGVPHSEILVLTSTRELRDAVLGASDETVAFGSWEDRDEGVVICQTIHRTKGLEATAVILVAPEDEPDAQLVYIGVSRAIWSLTLVGTAPLAALTGLTPDGQESPTRSSHSSPK